MSVIIKGMKMPKGCCECDLCDIGWGDECEPYCVITNSPLGGISNEREEWCPLIELPTLLVVEEVTEKDGGLIVKVRKNG